MNRQFSKINNKQITNQYNTVNNYTHAAQHMPIVAINLIQRPLLLNNNNKPHQPIQNTAQSREHGKGNVNKQYHSKNNQNQPYHPVKLNYICTTCGELKSQVINCCQNNTIKISSIFIGSALECPTFKLTHLFTKSKSDIFNQVPLTNEIISEAINNQQHIKLYSLKSYSLANNDNNITTRTEGNESQITSVDHQRYERLELNVNSMPQKVINTPLNDCVYILIPNNQSRLYVPKYGVIQLDGRNSFTLPTMEYVTVNNDIKKIII